MKLALATSLRAFIAEHRAAVPEALGPLREKAMLKGRSHHGGCALWPQGATAITSVLEGVHLLPNNVGSLTDAAGEQLRHL
jgi:hypothetical protein